MVGPVYSVFHFRAINSTISQCANRRYFQPVTQAWRDLRPMITYERYEISKSFRHSHGLAVIFPEGTYIPRAHVVAG